MGRKISASVTTVRPTGSVNIMGGGSSFEYQSSHIMYIRPRHEVLIEERDQKINEMLELIK